MKTKLYTINFISIIEMIYLMMSDKQSWTGLIRNLIFILKTVYRPSETNFILKTIK